MLAIFDATSEIETSFSTARLFSGGFGRSMLVELCASECGGSQSCRLHQGQCVRRNRNC